MLNEPTEERDSMGPGREQGVVLITVLWVLVLLSLIATNMSLGGRSFARQTLNAELGYRAGLAADAGLVWAMWGLQQPERAGWLADGGVHEMELGGTAVRVQLFDETGKLDLNTAPTELLDSLLAAAVEDSGERQALVAAIEDWRDEDDLIRLNGAEEAEYLAAGREKGPANRPFAEVDEVTQVLGMTPEIYSVIRWSVTVDNPTRTINPLFAPFDVLMALPGASEGVVAQFIDDRRQAWVDGLPVPDLPFDASPYVSDTDSGVRFTVYAEAAIGTDAVVRELTRLARRGALAQVVGQQPVYDYALLLEAAEGAGGREDE